MKLLLLSLLALGLAVNCALASDPVRVQERCNAQDCEIVIFGPDHQCLRKARIIAWESGLNAALYIRDCLDKGEK